MVIFHSYVSLPEGTSIFEANNQAEENLRELMQPELGKPHRVHDGQWLFIYLIGIYHTYVPVTLLYNILRTNSNIKLWCYFFSENIMCRLNINM